MCNYIYESTEVIQEKNNNWYKYKVVVETYTTPNQTLCHIIKVKFKFLCFWITIWKSYLYDEDYLRNIDYDYEYDYQLNNALDILHTLEV
jgi:hypothetical protein